MGYGKTNRFSTDFGCRVREFIPTGAVWYN